MISLISYRGVKMDFHPSFCVAAKRGFIFSMEVKK